MPGPLQNLILNIRANVSNALGGFRSVKKEAGELSNTLRQDLAGQLKAVFGVGAIYAFGQAIVQNARQLDQFAKSQGLTIAQASELQRIAEKYGVTAEQIIGNNSEVAKRQEDAIQRATEAWAKGKDELSALHRLGADILEGINLIADGAERALKAFQGFKTGLSVVDKGLQFIQHPFLAFEAARTGTTVEDLQKVRNQADEFRSKRSTKPSIIRETRARILKNRIEQLPDPVREAYERTVLMNRDFSPPNKGSMQSSVNGEVITHLKAIRRNTEESARADKATITF